MNEINKKSVGYGQQGEDDVNDISKVYVDDTVDFGTTCTDSTTTATIASTNSNDDDDDDDDNEGNSDEDDNGSYGEDNGSYGEEGNSNDESKNLQQNPYQDYLNTTADSTMIDNRQLTYIPIRLACGVCVYCSPDVLSNCPMVLRCIQADLTRAFKILPLSVHELIRKRTNLWLNWRGYAYGKQANPTILRHVTTHHSPGWLMECAIDTPQKAMGIEIYSCVDYQKMRLHWNGSGLLIHELCHLIHQCCLEDGLENQTVEALYERANISGKYEKVLRRDWAGKTTNITNGTSNSNSNTSNNNFNTVEEEIIIQQQQAIDHQPADFDLAYAMVDKKEFFAEISVAFLCNGYHAMDKADPNDMNDCNPPLLHPDVTERVLAAQHEYKTNNNAKTTVPTSNDYHYYHHVENKHHGTNDSNDSKTEGDEKTLSVCCRAPLPIIHQLVRKVSFALQQRRHDTNTNGYNNQLRMVDAVFQEDAISMNCINTYHCNKFYPFTRGQLQYYDPDLFDGIQNIWREIARLGDTSASVRLKNRILRSRCCTPSPCL